MKKPLQMKVIATKGTKELLRVDVNFGSVVPKVFGGSGRDFSSLFHEVAEDTSATNSERLSFTLWINVVVNGIIFENGFNPRSHYLFICRGVMFVE